MVVTGFELVGLIGALSATIDLVNKTIATARAYSDYDEDTARLLTRLLANKTSIQRYLQALRLLQQDSTREPVLTDEEAVVLATLSDDLDVIRNRLAIKSRRFDANSKSLSKMTWALWRKASFERDQALLDDWAQRIGLIYASIEASANTQRRLLAGMDISADRMARLVAAYQGISDRRHGNGSSLSIDPRRLTALGASSRRMPARLAASAPSSSATSVLVEYMAKGYSPNLEPAEIEQIGSATLALAKVLQYSEPAVTGLPRCCGCFRDDKSYRYGLVYELPADMMWSNDPKTNLERALSLRDLLNVNPRFPLDQKLRFCCDLAKAVLYVHFVGWVHKSIRPDNVVFLQHKLHASTPQFPYALTSPFLAGFEYARATAEGALSDRTSDADWRHNIYRHPNRQGIERNEEYNVAHDVYSLGAVLLEIGLWGTKGFVPFQHDRQEPHFAKASGVERKARLLKLADGMPDDQGQRYPLTTAMGTRYDRLVRYCLHIDEEAGLPTVAFIQKIWMELDDMRAAVS